MQIQPYLCIATSFYVQRIGEGDDPYKAFNTLSIRLCIRLYRIDVYLSVITDLFLSKFLSRKNLFFELS